MPVRRYIAAPPPPPASSLRSTALVTAAAVGAVATGTVTALLPAFSGSGTEHHLDGVLSASATTLPHPTLPPGATAALAPVAFTVETTGSAADHDQQLAQLGKATDLAAQLAELHAQQQREQAERARIASVIERGGLDGWIAEALRILDLPQSLAPSVKRIIMAESGGNPRAINNWDANARRGTPSQGLMQTIPSTYHKFVHPDLADRPITDPVANITAGIRYMIATYGMRTLEAGGRTNSSGGYVGY